ncbi:MAG: chromate transporter [Clostridia bacterium]|nr:chromate transporter [Clostridia bacterium]
MKKEQFKKTLSVFLTFLKIGAFTFGGGYAMIALIENEFISKKKWLTEDEFLDIVAIAESTPGPVAINSATFIGYKVGSFFGALAATVAVCIPSFLVIYIISLFLDRFLSFELVSFAFKGIQVCVLYLIFTAGIGMLKKIQKTAFNCAILAVVFSAMVLFTLFAVKFSTVYYILICGVFGVAVYALKTFKKKGAEK